NDQPSSPRQPRTRTCVAVVLVGGWLAGCQSLGPKADAPIADHQLISPLADAVIGDPSNALPLPRGPPARLPVPVIELEPVPDPPPGAVTERLRGAFSLPHAAADARRSGFEWFPKPPECRAPVLERSR